MTDAVLLVVIIALVVSGVLLPKRARLVAMVAGVTTFAIAAAIHRRDGAWTFIHNDVLVLLIASVGSCVATGALLREAVVFVNRQRQA